MINSSTQYSVSTARPTKALAILSMFKDFRAEDIEVIHEDSVKGYNIPLPISSVIERFNAGSHQTTMLTESHYHALCFDRYAFQILSTGETSTSVLL